MKILTEEQVANYLSRLREIGENTRLIDIHVHAAEVIFDEQIYIPTVPGIESTPGAQYAPPKPGRIRLQLPTLRSNQETLNRISKLSFSHAYQHRGWRVVEDHMSLCGVGEAILLPVARPGLDFDRQWQFTQLCCQQSKILALGYCVPNTIANQDIGRHLEQIAKQQPIRLLKIHPNLSDIDIQSADGLERIEAMLEACGNLSLPCLIHGGCSPILHQQAGHKHAIMAQLTNINWSLSPNPIVIAHFGAYGCQVNDLDNSAISELKNILNRHDNLYTDTSGVSYPVLADVLKKVDLDRVVFGSDALYVPMWHAMVSLAHALENLTGNFEQAIVKIAHTNTQKILAA